MSVILLILKILGIIVLIILGIIFLLILIPFFYRIHIKYTKEESDYSFKINTLFRFLYIIGDYSNELNLIVRILGIPVYKAGKYNKFSHGEEIVLEKSDELDNQVESDTDISCEDNVLEEFTSDTNENTKNKNKKKYKNENSKKTKIPLKERFLAIKNKINKNNIDAIKHIARCVGKFIKRIKPFIDFADCDYSLGSPDTTGMSYGIISILPSSHKKDIRICPDFNSDITFFYGEISLKGNIQILNAISLLVRILIDKNCRQLIFGGKK